MKVKQIIINYYWHSPLRYIQNSQRWPTNRWICVIYYLMHIPHYFTQNLGKYFLIIINYCLLFGAAFHLFTMNWLFLIIQFLFSLYDDFSIQKKNSKNIFNLNPHKV